MFQLLLDLLQSQAWLVYSQVEELLYDHPK